MADAARRAIVVDFDGIRPVPCPCGEARRALADEPAFPGTIHRTRISGAAERHYHTRLTETYYIIDCEPGAEIELDGERHPLKPGACVVIPPGVRHRALGTMTILNIVLPKFDPTDEFVD
jgi:mannose-6-phosphate isomerase-like protein (cupin superfamily)